MHIKANPSLEMPIYEERLPVRGFSDYKNYYLVNNIKLFAEIFLLLFIIGIVKNKKIPTNSVCSTDREQITFKK